MREPHFKPFPLGRYRCEERLRAGGIGDLYLAVHLPSGNRRTVWKVCPDLLEDPESAEQLLQVQLRLQTLTHPNIIPVREIFQKESAIYVAMDHQPGISLRQVLLRLPSAGPLTPSVASFVVWQICQALDHAHHLKDAGRPSPLIHGALWPQNVLLSPRGEVRLTDFGTWLVPRAAYEDDEVSVRTHFSHRAPEHVIGETLTTATDLFCVGVLLSEMITARPLFLAPTLMGTVERVEHADVGPLTGVPVPIASVLRRCMAAQPNDRFPDVAAFIAELSLAVSGVGDPAVRQELVRFLAAHFVVPESPTSKPAPLPGQEADEITNISPSDLTEVLLALSRQRTEPGKVPQRIPAVMTGPQRLPPRASPPLPMAPVNALAPEPLDFPSTRAEMGDESPTTGQATPHKMPSFAGTSPDSGAPALFPPQEQKVPDEETTGTDAEVLTHVNTGEVIKSYVTGETTGSEPAIKDYATGETTAQAGRGRLEMGEEEPTFTLARPDLGDPDEMLPTGRLPPVGDSSADDLPTLNEKPFAELGPQALGRPNVGREIALQLPPPPEQIVPPRWPSSPIRWDSTPPPSEGAPRGALVHGPDPASRPPGATGPAPALRAPVRPPGPTLPSLMSSVPDQNSPLPGGGGGESGLFFEETRSSLVEDAEPPGPSIFEPNEGTPLSAFDPDAFSASYSQSYEAYKRRARVSPAHVMLAVAVLVFLVAVAMLVRRLVSSQPVGAAAPQLEREAGPRPRPDLRIRPRPDQRAEVVPQAGKEYADLLKGKLAPGELRVSSEPARARVFVGGKLRGQTPLVLRQKPRERLTMALVLPGHDIRQEQISLPADRGQRLSLKLSKSTYPRRTAGRYGLLRVRCRGREVQGRRIFINGEDTGLSCDKVNFRLRPGIYRIGFYSVERNQMMNMQPLRIKARKTRWMIVRAKSR